MNSSKEKGIALTDSEFWNEGWDRLSLPFRLNINSHEGNCFNRLFYRKVIPGKKSLLEVGCAPGKFMIYFAEQFGFRVSGIDFSQSGYEMTCKNLELTGVKGDVIEGDFLSYPLPKERWDIVFSAGFVEHFSDPFAVLQKKISLLKPGGILLTTIPNFAGFTGLTRRVMNHEIYLKHNPISGHDLLNIYKSLALKDIDVGYFGSLRFRFPEPRSPFYGKKISWFIARALDKAFVSCYKILCKSIEGPWLSSSIYAYGIKRDSQKYITNR